MKILVMAVGSGGDVAPYTGVGVRLQEEGHEVVLATEGIFASLVQEWRTGVTGAAPQGFGYQAGVSAAQRAARQLLHGPDPIAVDTIPSHVVAIAYDEARIKWRKTISGAERISAHRGAAGLRQRARGRGRAARNRSARADRGLRARRTAGQLRTAGLVEWVHERRRSSYFVTAVRCTTDSGEVG